MFDPAYISLATIIKEIKSANPAKRKIAIAITGGGARGAYEAGAMEAIISSLKTAGLAPDVIVGTSAGAIVSTTTFIDLIYPKKPSNPRTSIEIYKLRVSDIWRKLSMGNRGAEQVVDKKWLVEYATHQKSLPIQEFFNSGERLSVTFDNFVLQIKQIGKDFERVMGIVSNYLSLIKFDDFEKGIDSLKGNLAALLEKVAQAKRLADMYYRNPTDLSILPSIAKLIVAIVGDILRVIGDIALKIPSGILKDLIESVISLVNNFKKFIGELGPALGALASDFGKILGSGGKVIGDFAVFMSELAKAILTLQYLIPFIGAIAIAGAGGVMLTDHILSNEMLAKLHDTFMDDSLRLSKSISLSTPVNGNEEIIKDYNSRLKNEKMPELFLSGTNLSASRQIIFSLARPASIEKLASSSIDRGVWVVDLTKQTQLRSNLMNLFHPHGDMKKLLTTATITSTAIPMVFPPVKWKIVHSTKDQGKQQTFNHVCVDGGVLDNTPIDIAAFVGATHIISIELTPLVDPLYSNTINVNDRGYNLATVGAASFFTSMDASLLNRISSIVDQNKMKINSNNLADVIQIYRIAPLINKTQYDPQRGKDKKASIGLIDFDGLYDEVTHRRIMSIYDWFMQGYIDAMGISLPTSQNYPTFNDYMANGRAMGCEFNYRFMGNQFWRATKQAAPQENLENAFLVKWIRCMYLDLFEREPDETGLAFHLNLLTNGSEDKESLVKRLMIAPEYLKKTVNTYYDTYLGRQSDPGGLDYYVTLIGKGTSFQDVIVSLCDSQEFKNKHPVPYEFTRALYNKILGRAPESGAVENNPLLHGVPTGEYIRRFLTSPEYASKVITLCYNKYLGRAPEPGAVEAGIPRLQTESLQQITRGFLLSEEYQSKSLAR